ncbi:MAG: FHA domain-containing protein [Propionibacteriaceae bacterium]|nr:FHA domain-containing protein [Propionibacteriaceae bacterium]
MTICPNGHSCETDDFCDTCGAALVPQTSMPQTAAQTIFCPHCGAQNVPRALFCESCGCDFTAGTVPDNSWLQPTEKGSLSIFDNQENDYFETDAEADVDPDDEYEVDEEGEEYEDEDTGFKVQNVAAPESVKLASLSDVVVSQEKPLEWVGELWIDPDWYELQGSPDPLPSAGLPDIIPLKKRSILVGRASASLNSFPDIDCDLDNGCSRKHAMLTTDGTRWWVEDLDSANGTFVGPANSPLPSMPIPRGKMELDLNQRVYLGSWTRIVIRKATQDELEAFAD